MKKTLSILLFSLIALELVAVVAFAQNTQSAAAPAAQPVSVPAETPAAAQPAVSPAAAPPPTVAVSASTQEVEVLQAQLATMRDYQDDLISIVLWALGTVVAIAIGLAAFSWYTNKNNHDRDREALDRLGESMRQELKARVSDDLRTATTQLVAALNEKQKSIEQNVAAVLDKSNAPKFAKYDERLGEIDAAIWEIETDMLDTEAEQAFKDKRFTWAIYRWCEALQKVVPDADEHWRIDEILDNIGRALTGHGGKALGLDDVNRTVTALNALPAAYRPGGQALIQRINALPTA